MSCLQEALAAGFKFLRGRQVFIFLPPSLNMFHLHCLQPFDTVKVRLQTQPRENPLYNGIGDCVSKTFKSEGFKGFYRGTLTPLVGVGACVSIQFGALEFAKRKFTSYNASAGNKTPEHLSIPQLFLAGAASGVANSVLSGPIEHVRTRLQVQGSAANGNPTYSGPLDFARKVAGQHGIGGLYKGQGVTVLREFLGYGAYFATYEWLIQRAMKNEGKRRDQIETWKQCLYGATAGYGLWLSVYPIDVVKSKLQTDGFEPSTRRYAGMIDCARKTLAQDGVAGFYRGTKGVSVYYVIS